MKLILKKAAEKIILFQKTSFQMLASQMQN